MKKLNQTLFDLNQACKDKKYILTRFNEKGPYFSDLDILVKDDDFDHVVNLLVDRGYQAYSHDAAFGGRIKRYQVNLIKKGRIKIDLHKDFTWRKTKYIDLDLIWGNLKRKEITDVNVNVPEEKVDTFLILINLIFEKTYITKDDCSLIKDMAFKVFSDGRFTKQSGKYGWKKTWQKLIVWFNKRKVGDSEEFPVFLPISFVLYSYLEKLIHDRRLDLISLLYYFFFRTRYLVNRKLPYE